VSEIDRPDDQSARDIEKEAKLLLDELQAEVTPEEEQKLFKRTRDLGYDARQRSLSAADNFGEAAIVVEPIESPLWYVATPDGDLSNPDDPAEVLQIARDVLTWTNRVISGPRPKPA
jgi:hypothetical protein